MSEERQRVELEALQQSGVQGSPGMCPVRPGGDRLDQGPLLQSVGVAASRTLSEE